MAGRAVRARVEFREGNPGVLLHRVHRAGSVWVPVGQLRRVADRLHDIADVVEVQGVNALVAETLTAASGSVEGVSGGAICGAR